jgi:hypothetical protein
MTKNKAKSIVLENYPKDNPQLCEALEVLIPELKSKDERIREALIEAFEQYDEDECWRDIPDLKIKDILSWLEKQKRT